MLKTFSTAALLAVAGAVFAQTTPSQTPAVTPSQGPIVSPSPVTPPAAVGGLSRCENLIGLERDSCMQQQRAGTGSTAPGSTAPGSTTSANTTSGSITSGTSTQPTAPIGSPTGTVR
jgi:hypothetical protein